MQVVEPQELIDARNAIRSWGYECPLDTADQIIAFLRDYMAHYQPGSFCHAVANAHLRELTTGPDPWRSR